MSVQLNHTIILARDNKQGAEFLAKILGVEVGPTLGPFVTLPLANKRYPRFLFGRAAY